VSIKVECPQDTYAEIEEHCINKGISPSKYFMNLHNKENKIGTRGWFSLNILW
jgi:hypothetical protein